MKILIAHNRYQTMGGEDSAVRNETEMLRRGGHAVELLTDDNDAIRGVRGVLAAAASVAYSPRSRRRMRSAIGEFKPQILHVTWLPTGWMRN